MTDGLDWLRTSRKKRNTGYHKGNEDEKQGAKELGMKRTKGSGSSGLRKGDLFDSYFAGELKCTDAKQYTLHLKDLLKLLDHAREAGTIPYFRLTFRKPVPRRFVIMLEEDFKALKEYKEGK